MGPSAPRCGQLFALRPAPRRSGLQPVLWTFTESTLLLCRLAEIVADLACHLRDRRLHLDCSLRSTRWSCATAGAVWVARLR